MKKNPRAQLNKAYRRMINEWAKYARFYQGVQEEMQRWSKTALRNIRQELKLSQKEMGERLGVSRCTISRIEKGRLALSISVLFKIEALIKPEEQNAGRTN